MGSATTSKKTSRFHESWRNEVFLFSGRCRMRTTCIVVLSCFIAFGCATTQNADMPEKMPQLIEQEPFPPMSASLMAYHSELDLRILVADDGSVEKAEIMNPSGDAAWDELADSRMKLWKFSPAIHDGKPVTMWINFHAHVKCEIPVYIGLAEIVCATATVADSVYTLLRAGEAFDALASNFSISKSKQNHGDLGQVDISRYGEKVRHVLKSLDENEYTEPLALGDHFVIFKRLAADVRFE